jgi:D-alanyl-D-alanine dipeptidase
MVIYEAYRPQKATQNFLRWSQGEGDDRMQRLYYPRLPKSDLFNKGYISSRSAHTRGAAVDVSIIELGKKLHPTLERKYKLSDGTELIYLDDGSVDMGAHFDLLDEASWHDNELVTKEQSSMRNLLREKMEKHGFKRYDKEWWHYSLKQEPFPDTYFDFDITG